MFTKKLALALCVGAVVLLATAGANATITVTPITAAATYDLTGADDYWVVGTQAEGGNGLLALSFAYTTTINWNYAGPGSPWQPSPETVTLTNPGDSNNTFNAVGPAITVGGVTTTGFHEQSDRGGSHFSYDTGGAVMDLHVIFTESPQYWDGNKSITVNAAGQTGVVLPLPYNLGQGWFEVTVTGVQGAGTFGTTGDTGYGIGGMSTAWFTSAPEPATMCLLAIGGIGALLKRRRKV